MAQAQTGHNRESFVDNVIPIIMGHSGQDIRLQELHRDTNLMQLLCIS